MKSLESIYNSILLENQNTNNIDLELLNSCINGTYTINDDGSIDVDGNVNLSRKKLTKIPFNFSKVSGSFYCTNNQLTSLKGAPNTVGGYFSCSNNQLTTLEGAPNTVGDNFYCTNNQLTTLEGAPNTVGGDFCCTYNQLTTLDGAPNTVGGGFDCSDNQLTSLEGAPNNVGGYFYCYNNQNLPYSELFKIVDNISGDIFYSSFNTSDDKDKIRRDRDVKETLRDDELGSLDV